ncbi:hypothetical protein Aph02nite_33400 [Actinoplanes philippinensis]|uniref:Uncharacterized protein n=1 Tax=Actinoplanes philippinensis TaxID=35752 RepID=A0A1I2DYS2_9ACTN|nr:hypothetical protein [Actinoplanes philippinensis]GIE77390.1 hypothetical protein Aph02nite_33400 [Actinoplanes philippinensis]SFE85606.1 hypothetical protein SAMN05421541_10463 [Actinoplanes philippinensis]
MSLASGGGSRTLPLTGAVLVVGGTAVPAPTLAAIGAAIIIGGFLLIRLTRPRAVGAVAPGRPGRAKSRMWRRGSI